MRERFHEGWEFCKAQPGTTYEEMTAGEKGFLPVSLPHDFAIESFESFYQDAMGWYRKTDVFTHQEDERVILYFDAVYMDTTVFLNGRKLAEWKYGYTPFEVDLTDALREGSNELMVSVDYRNPNSRWYSGAGIIRNVWIDRVPELHIPRHGVYVHAEPGASADMWVLTVDTELVGGRHDLCKLTEETVSKGFHYEAGTCVNDSSLQEEISLECISTQLLNQKENGLLFRSVFAVKDVKVWDIEEPNLYRLRVSYEGNSQEETTFGFRELRLDPDTGMWLNGRNIKLNGVCEHHDHGMIGAAFYEDAALRKLIRLKDMGANSIRFSHNPVDPKVLDLCDRLGFLIISEAFDMWENQKTTYDYGRFFSEWHERDVRAWVRQDRNHPSLLMWCIGNEIYDIHQGERGRQLVRELSGLVREYDPLHNGYITFASNYMPWENAQKAADDVEVVGYNYAEKYYEEHHKAHPDWIIYGSETSSIVYSRGVYRFPFEIACMSDDDEQCSAMGNSTTSWGAESLEACINTDRDMKFSLGQYIWTGHDYLGEPTPYHTKNSYFGAIDTAGYPKDAYYAWKAAWTDRKREVVLYLSPDWDYNEGQTIDLRVTSNAPFVEVFVNGESLGRKALSNQPNSGLSVIAGYKAAYRKGEIRAVAYDEQGRELKSVVRTSYQDTAKLVCEKETFLLNGRPVDPSLYRDGEYGNRLHFYDVYALDQDGRVVENACDLVDIKVSGGGVLLACDNGDSTDYSNRNLSVRRLFKGRLLITVLEVGEEPIHVNVERRTDFIPTRKIQLISDSGKILGPDRKQVVVRAEVSPANASCRDISFRVTDLFGNTAQSAKVTKKDSIEDDRIKVEAIGDGCFKVRAFSKDGSEGVRVISELDFEAEGLGVAFLDPYTFIPGSAYSHSYGKVTNGNERGIATQRAEETVVVFENVDFGSRGCNTLTIPIFSLDYDRIDIDIYDGDYREEGCEQICAGVYDRPRIWNVYQEETFTLSKKLTGVHTISFRTKEKIHIKGFFGEKVNTAYLQQMAVDAVKIYGDTFTVEEKVVSRIGNNVTIDFGQMDFGAEGPTGIVASGRARGNRNTVHIRFFKENGEEVRSIMEWDPAEEFQEQRFALQGISGEGNVQLIFLPGCNFDLNWIRFEK